MIKIICHYTVPKNLVASSSGATHTTTRLIPQAARTSQGGCEYFTAALVCLLHSLRYVDTTQWSPLIEIPENRLIITPSQGDVMSILVKRL